MPDKLRLEAALERFRNPSGRKSPAFGLGHIREALEAMGDPQHDLPPAIHVTGTNGKGSVCAFLRALGEAAGLRVHVFTSPHLARVNERIRLAGDLVEDEVLAEVLEEVAGRSPQLTYFEALTAAAFRLFADTPADLCVIEVGAGGDGDATNVMARPAACVVTRVSLDHEAMFGVHGVAAIARIKSGIFREGSPAVIGEQSPIALGVLMEEARVRGAPPFVAGRNWRAGWDGPAFVYSEEGEQVARSPWLGLAGRHQAENAGAALAALRRAGHARVSADVLAAGLRAAVWPARLHKLSAGPLTAGVEASVWVDGAHNPGGAEALAAAIREHRPEDEPDDHVTLIVAMQAAKDMPAMMRALAPVADDVIACPLPPSGGQEGGEGAEPAAIAAAARAAGAHAMTAGSYRDALRLARAGGAKRIYLAGSLYLCGAALRDNGEEPT